MGRKKEKSDTTVESMLLCPKCGKPLGIQDRVMVCPARHSYDISAQGYVNLLLSGKSGDSIGDGKEMIAARRGFLDTGCYEPLATAVCEKVAAMAEGKAPLHLLDAGCGEGYYTRAVEKSLPRGSRVVGIDISRHGCLAAAKRDQNSLYVTAGASGQTGTGSHPPNRRQPTAFGAEFRRVLAPGGKVLQVVPGRNHLLQLKEAVYEKAYPNREDKHLLEGFTLASTTRLEYQVTLENNAHIRQLFAMTPYFFRTPREGVKRLEALEQICITLDFLMLEFH